MKLEIGKYYRTRDGRKVGPLKKWYSLDGIAGFHWAGSDDAYQEDGTSIYDGQPEQQPVAEWTDKTQTGTLQELYVNPGDVVEYIADCRKYEVKEIGILKSMQTGVDIEYRGLWNLHGANFRIISRAKPTGPVVTETVTTKRIVPGIYGRLDVDHWEREGCVYIGIVDADKGKASSWHRMTREDLTAAIETLTEIMEAMDG